MSERRSARGAGGGRSRVWPGVAAAGMAVLAACSLDGLLGTDELPPDVTDPAITQTPEGAVQAYYGTRAQFREAFGQGLFSAFTVTTGLLTDELEWGGGATSAVDMRHMPQGEETSSLALAYSGLQKVRGQASQAIGLLTRFAPDSLAPLTGHLYAVQAYAEIFLAELFCSGIPLSTLDYEGDFTYAPGSTTEEVYQHTLALLDTALTLVGDSARFAHLARVGRARALLGLGRFADAAAAVAEVPDDFRYEVSYSAADALTAENFARLNLTGGLVWNFTVGDGEGVNGLDYVSSGDPRTQVTSTWGTNLRGLTIHHPSKYATDGSGPIVLASGLEARLIEAEAALEAADVGTWLDKLNHPRQTLWTTIEPAVAGPLPDLADPGTAEARVDLLFRERAFWLFLTGQRQGDLRRLMRRYGRTQDQLYPVGTYADPVPGLSYGSHVDLPVPLDEQVLNPRYSGCISRA